MSLSIAPQKAPSGHSNLLDQSEATRSPIVISHAMIYAYRRRGGTLAKMHRAGKPVHPGSSSTSLIVINRTAIPTAIIFAKRCLLSLSMPFANSLDMPMPMLL